MGELTIFGLKGGCTSLASTFSQSILLVVMFMIWLVAELVVVVVVVVSWWPGEYSDQFLAWCQGPVIVPSKEAS